MRAMFRGAAAAVSFAVTAPVALAESPAGGQAPAGIGGPAPGWNGYEPGPWMMGGWEMPMMGYGGWGGYGGGWLMMFLGGVIFVALLIFIFRAFAWTSNVSNQRFPLSRTGSAGLHSLDERYARGEINREEYLQKKRDILDV